MYSGECVHGKYSKFAVALTKVFAQNPDKYSNAYSFVLTLSAIKRHLPIRQHNLDNSKPAHKVGLFRHKLSNNRE